MTTGQPRPVLELVPAGAPAEWSDLGEPLAEAAVLGCLMRTSRQHAAALLGAFTDEDLTVPQHRHVAAAARALLEQGHPVDPVTVLGQLRRQGTENARTDNRDAGVLLVELCQAAPCAGSAGHYLRIVLEHAYRRRAQQAATRAPAGRRDRVPDRPARPGRARAPRAHGGAPPHHRTPAVAGPRLERAPPFTPTPGALPCPTPDPTWPAPPPWPSPPARCSPPTPPHRGTPACGRPCCPPRRHRHPARPRRPAPAHPRRPGRGHDRHGQGHRGDLRGHRPRRLRTCGRGRSSCGRARSSSCRPGTRSWSPCSPQAPGGAGRTTTAVRLRHTNRTGLQHLSAAAARRDDDPAAFGCPAHSPQRRRPSRPPQAARAGHRARPAAPGKARAAAGRSRASRLHPECACVLSCTPTSPAGRRLPPCLAGPSWLVRS